MGFSNTKDRVFAGYEKMSSWLARRPKWVRTAVYQGFGAVFYVAYALPGNSVRPTMTALAARVDAARWPLFRGYVRRFLSGTALAERIRHGYGDELNGMLEIPDQDRLDDLLKDRGVFLALPHMHAAFAMVFCLSQNYPVLAVVSLTRNPKRAQAQRALYEQANCDLVDVRSEDPGAVARKILKALKSGTIVVGTVDRIQKAPKEAVDKARDVVRVTAFDAPVGYGGWPTRFATKARAPIVPAGVEQTRQQLRLIMGEAIVPTDDMVETTQAWVSELERLVRDHPTEWAFSLDKHWSRVLRNDPPPQLK